MSLDLRQLEILNLVSDGRGGSVLQYLLQHDNAVPFTAQNYREIVHCLPHPGNNSSEYLSEKIHKAIVITQPENAHLWLETMWEYLIAADHYDERFWVYSLKGMFQAAAFMDKQDRIIPYQEQLPAVFAKLLCARLPARTRLFKVNCVDEPTWTRLTDAIKEFFFNPGKPELKEHRQTQALSVLHYIGNHAVAEEFGPLNLHLFQKLLHIFLSRSPTNVLLEAAAGIRCNEFAVE